MKFGFSISLLVIVSLLLSCKRVEVKYAGVSAPENSPAYTVDISHNEQGVKD